MPKLHPLSSTFVELHPNGELAKKSLRLLNFGCALNVADAGPIASPQFAKGAGVSFDWYNDRLQIVIDDSKEDAAIHVRFNRDGAIAEILLRDEDLLKKCIVESAAQESPWQTERDHR